MSKLVNVLMSYSWRREDAHGVSSSRHALVHSGRRTLTCARGDVETYTTCTREDGKTVSYNRVNEVNDSSSERSERLPERAQRVSPRINV